MTYKAIFRKLKLIDRHLGAIPDMTDDLGDLEPMLQAVQAIIDDALEIVRDLAMEE